MKTWKKLKRNFKVFVIMFLAIYGFVMYKYQIVGTTTYGTSDYLETQSQGATESSLDTNTNEENDTSDDNTEVVSEEESKSYDLNSIDGREEYIWDWLIKAGFSKIQVAAIIGNMRQENYALLTSREESDGILNGVGYGLCQWSYGRRQNLVAYAKEKGMSVNSIDLQLSFFCHEYNTTGFTSTALKNTFKNTDNLENAVNAFCDGFERPKAACANKAQRLNYAQVAWDKYAN